MTDADFMKPMVVAALEFHGGMATLVDVAKYIWKHHQNDLEEAGDLYYRWQYVMRWSATKLRHDGRILPAKDCDRGVWALA